MNDFLLDYAGLGHLVSKIESKFSSASIMQVQLTNNNWNNKTYIIANTFFKAADSYVYFVAPDENSRDTYLKFDVHPLEVESNGYIVFKAESKPDGDITVDILRLKVS